MTDPLAFPARADLRAIWVFGLGVPADDLPRWLPPQSEDEAQDDWPLMGALGLSQLDAAHVEVFEAADLEPVGLIEYLAEANAMDREQVEADRAKLATLTGAIVLVHAGALPVGEGAMTPQTPLRFVGRYERPYTLRPAAQPAANMPGQLTPQGPALDMRFPWRIFAWAALGFSLLLLILWMLI